ncbi:chemotaxis protein CheA [Magnetospirillum sulfuroxidans]|uniref:Chemotaxis protein CheA n=1 Tax=Magnetospirillum sulfuroxidans TaxID=611300 RepID=A0ABS5IDG4_9PROT|nr:chemotaxis protein CheA [Magnetospirillum sulfuroxidans]MBR9972472.1 chemotaxis protein CheA [Magnetospirillum sulfuroxidans]
MAIAPDPAATFRQEAEDLLVQLESALLDLESRPDDMELVNSAFRALHTIKGSGAMFGFEAVAGFTHHVETAFDMVRTGRLAISRELVNLTLASLDHMRSMIEVPDSEDTIRSKALLASFQDITRHATKDGVSDTPPETEENIAAVKPDGPTTYRVRFKLAENVMSFGTNPLLLLDELAGLGTSRIIAITDHIPPLEEMDPEKCYTVWDVLLTTDKPPSAIEDVFIFVIDDMELSIQPLEGIDEEGGKRLGEILIERGDITPDDLVGILRQQERLGSLLVKHGKVSPDKVESALSEQRAVQSSAQTKAASEAATNVRVPAERLDGLMDLVGQLVIAQARLTQLASHSADSALKSIAEEIDRLSSELRDTTMNMRMVPISTLFGKFRRVVRTLSQELGKTIELTMAGEETELDKTVIESLNDPLVHLIRNSIDHGIEDADTRKRHGKREMGRLHLSALHSGAQVHISVRDDGQGMDRDAIRAKAVERGLLQPNQDVTDSDLFGFVFHPGFSTARQLSAVSGRGVGMDVVKKTMDKLRASIDVGSEPGRGTAVTLKLPLTLAIIDGLLVRVASGHFVVPLTSVEECVELTQAQDHTSEGRQFLNIRDEIVPYIRLWELFGAAAPSQDTQKVVIVSFGEHRVGFVVDQVIGQYQTVIKSLSKLHRDVEGFSGATILGDGTVALILDIPHLMQFAQDRESALKSS